MLRITRILLSSTRILLWILIWIFIWILILIWLDSDSISISIWLDFDSIFAGFRLDFDSIWLDFGWILFDFGLMRVLGTLTAL